MNICIKKNNISGIYIYDGRGSVSSVISGFGDYRATYWYDGLGNVIRNLYGAGDSNNRYKPYYGYNAEQYNPVTGNQNLRARQFNIRRQRFLTEDTYLGNKTDTLSINRYIYGNDNPLKFKDLSGFISNSGMSYASSRSSSTGCGGNNSGNLDYYVKYGFSSAESWEYWNAIATNAVNAEIIRRGITYQISLQEEATIAGELLRDIISRENAKYNQSTQKELIAAQAIHYTRNKYNIYNADSFPDYIDISKIGKNFRNDIYSWNSNIAANAHHFNRDIFNIDSRNIKLVDATGHLEVIYDAFGNIIYSPESIWSYNFYPSNISNPIEHYSIDIEPWIVWGNSPDDTTISITRVLSLGRFW